MKCYPSVIATEPLHQPIMNETDNNVTNYIIQMIPQQPELCVMMLSIWQSMKLQPFTPKAHKIQKYMTWLCMPLMSLGEDKAMLSARLIKKIYFFMKILTQNLNHFILQVQLIYMNLLWWLLCRQVHAVTWANNVRNFISDPGALPCK